MKNILFSCLVVLVTINSGCKTGKSLDSKQIIIFHAGSLSVPFRELAREYEKKNPGMKVLLEPAGSLVCARKITELKMPCDIIASADYFVIDELLIPQYATWGIRFATNELVIAFQQKSKYAADIDSTNWIDILLRGDVTYARSDPDSDPCGYRSVLLFMLSERYYGRVGLAESLLAKDSEFIRPKEVDLVALVEANAVDYMFQYKSVAIQHNLKYIELPDGINLGSLAKESLYNSVSYYVTGSSPGSKMKIKGEYINYSLALLSDCINRRGAIDFVAFLLGSEGMNILKKNGQDPIVPCMTDDPDKLPEELVKYILE